MPGSQLGKCFSPFFQLLASVLMVLVSLSQAQYDAEIVLAAFAEPALLWAIGSLTYYTCH
jgi:hypothetical protein